MACRIHKAGVRLPRCCPDLRSITCVACGFFLGFGCRGSVQRTAKWCWHPIPIDGGTLGIAPIQEGGTVTAQFEVRNLGTSAGAPPEFISYMVQALSGDTGQPSEAVSLNGLPPGTPYIGELRVAAGGIGLVPIGINYGCGSLIEIGRAHV